MNPPPASSPPPGNRGALIAAAILVAIGMVLFGVGAVAKLGEREPALLGFSALAVATAGFVCTLAGGLWLRQLVGK